MTEPNLSTSILLTQWARLLLGSFSDAGVSTVVLSPGSRSTPFAAAALAHPSLECLSIVDERDAAFFALGRAKADGKPVLVICTSGTAGANYLPAVIEAESSYTPLLILTADRPTELAHCHAPQTIDQVKLFGDHARGFFELGAPEAALPALLGLRRTAAQAVHRARTPLPGAVHLNARARKPLEPAAAGGPEAEALTALVSQLLERPIVRAEPAVFALGKAPEDALIEALQSHERGLIVAGPGPACQRELGSLAEDLARRCGYPLWVEAASQWRFQQSPEDAAGGPVRLGCLDALGRSPTLRKGLIPQVILQLGAAPIAAGWSQYLEAHGECPRFVLHPHGWQDPWSNASWMMPVDLSQALPSILRRLGEAPARPGSPWLSTWQSAERLAREAADTVVTAADGELSEGLVARLAVEALPPGGGLALGNSLPIREADAYAPPTPKTLTVWSQRGASGIDGVLAGAAGFASVLGQPTVLLIGDVSFLHSLSGLAAMRHVTSPLAVLVVNNDGGRIFEQLPLAQTAASLGLSMDPWITPHGLDLEPAAGLFQLPFRRVSTQSDLRAGLQEALARPGASILEARVPPGGAILQNLRLWRLTEEALARELSSP